ncbi:synembryn-A-like protein [Dinothrombium tinctorium]|uniref:Synembryn-A-like protein n=1 Tax=Dinothrombium tinctorium TaxID=1965070 RepID=A0A3S3SEU1_9ACAR|nr:synembryn-A-like protein [Dinothrombium tinctorium]RWS13317.1 synembryn-A-like protein [Dinothrombium tinctorium]RWS14306.1 synembryn-A-like protein [Dinothrombium tinctorium]RWS14319.1 synembryn-A-like protein [Dinothrombium tinctorium]
MRRFNCVLEANCSFHIFFFFLLQNSQQFTVEESLAKKKQLVDGLFRRLRDVSHTNNLEIYLATLRILSRDRNHLDDLFTIDKIETILHLARLVGEEEAFLTENSVNFDSTVIVEAQKCLCNLIYNSTIIQKMCCSNSCIDGIMLRLRMYKDPMLPVEVKYFDMRMLFLLTALNPEIRPKIREDYHGLIYLMEAIDLILKEAEEPGQKPMKKSKRKRKGREKSDNKNVNTEEDTSRALHDSSVNLCCEVLKVLFNLTVNIDRENVDEVEEAHYLRLVGILHDLLLSDTKSKEKREELQSHTINLLTNMPAVSYEELLVPIEEIGKIDSSKYEYDDMNVEAITVLLEFLEKRLEKQPSKTMQESLAPILTCLCEMSRSNRVIRKYLRSQVLPPLKDVMSRPEEGTTIRNRLVKLMTNPNTDVKELVADFLFVLCKENVGRLIKYTGYGNAAGLLANRGLMLGGRGRGSYSSESEDSDTEEYLKCRDKINPVIGCYEEPRKNPMEGMTEEQKEYEAMQLVNMMDKLTRTGVVQPCRVGEDGKPHPIEHVLELQDTTEFRHEQRSPDAE